MVLRFALEILLKTMVTSIQGENIICLTLRETTPTLLRCLPLEKFIQNNVPLSSLDFSLNLLLCAENTANIGRATQSSQAGDAGPEKAIDGNYNTKLEGGSCSKTWWRLDLLRPYKIKNVIVAISENNLLYQSMNGAVILIGNSLLNNGTSNPR